MSGRVDTLEQHDGLNGNTHRNSMYGPRAQHWDLSIAKEFPIREQIKLQFRAEGFNVTNTPSFGLPGTGLASAYGQGSSSGGGPPGPPYGSITATSVGSNPRQMQFALKVTF